MSLKAELEALRAAKPRTYKEWLRVASAEDRALVDAAIRDRTLPSSGLTLTLRANGVPITQQTIESMRHDAQ